TFRRRCAGRLLLECANCLDARLRAGGHQCCLHRCARRACRWLGCGRRGGCAGGLAHLATLKPCGAPGCCRFGNSHRCSDYCGPWPGQIWGIATPRSGGAPGVGDAQQRFCHRTTAAIRRDPSRSGAGGACDRHRAALDRWVAEQLQAGATPEHVLDGLTAAHPIRLMSSMALAIAQNAEVIAGFPTTGPSRVASRGGVWNTFMEELAPSSIWLRNSLRTALGIALAVLVARSLAVPYAFWVV